MKKITLLLFLLVSIVSIQAQSIQKSKSRVKLSSNKIQPIANSLKSTNPSISSSVIFADNMEGDNTVAGLVARGYTTYFRGTGGQGGPGQVPEWIQGDTSYYKAYNGSDSSYVSSTFLSVVDSNDINNWLVLPQFSITAGNVFSFYSRTEIGTSFLDSIRVMYNPTGATLPEDLNWVELSRFQLDTASSWLLHSFAAPTSNATGVFAIRHVIVNSGPNGTNGDVIGIDEIEINDTSTIVLAPVNDDCIGAIDLNTLFGQPLGIEQVAGPYDNTLATHGITDPTTGFECWGEPNGLGGAPEINNSLWFTFVGDGNNYFVESGTCAGVTNYLPFGDTQFAMYTGTCGALVPEKCNEDGPNANSTLNIYPAGFSFGTIPGVTYYLMVDGYSDAGSVSRGEFCIKVTRLQSITCSDTTLTLGTITQTPTNICFGDTLHVSAIGAIAPNTGSFNGIVWVISSAPITGSTDPRSDISYIGSYGFQSPAPDTLTATFVNDGTLSFIQPGATFYWTPVIFGNAVNAGTVATPTVLHNLTADPNCTTTGTSIAFNLLVAGDPLCSVGIDENTANSYYGISNIYPIPAKNDITFTINARENTNLVIALKDNLGKDVSSKQYHASKGENKITLDLSNLASGFYFINVTGDKGSYNVKFVKN